MFKKQPGRLADCVAEFSGSRGLGATQVNGRLMPVVCALCNSVCNCVLTPVTVSCALRLNITLA